jgi:hypothetical protein
MLNQEDKLMAVVVNSIKAEPKGFNNFDTFSLLLFTHNKQMA